MNIFFLRKTTSFNHNFKAEKIHENAPEADPVEKQEEMDRMREHVMKEFDKNNDRMLSYAEFEHGINGTEARNDQGWQVNHHTNLTLYGFSNTLFSL